MLKNVYQRVGVFVDVANMYHSARNLYNGRVNFAEILKIGGLKICGRYMRNRDLVSRFVKDYFIVL